MLLSDRAPRSALAMGLLHWAIPFQDCSLQLPICQLDMSAHSLGLVMIRVIFRSARLSSQAIVVDRFLMQVVI